MRLATLLCALAMGCGSTTGPSMPDAVTIESIVVTPSTLTTKRGLDKPTQLTVMAMLSSSGSVDITSKARFASSDVTVATVSPTGLVTPTGAGTTMIKTDFGNNSTTATITVISPSMYTTESSGTIGINVFDAYQAGNIAPSRQITGALTTFTLPWTVLVYNDEIYVTDPTNSAVDVFPVTATGNVAPTRRIVGAATTLTTLSFGLTIANDELYVTGTNKILVFPVTANGNVAPTRTITGALTTLNSNFVGLHVYKDELYVANFPSSILVFPRTANGNVAPTRTITGTHTTLTGVMDLRVVDDEIFAATQSGVAATNGVRVFLSSANGDAAPIRNILGPTTSLSTPFALAVLGNEIYTTNILAPLVGISVHPKEATGDAAAVRTLTGALTLITAPRSAAFF